MLVDDAGKIRAVGEYRNLARTNRKAKTVDFSDRLLIPGFVDAHVHLPQYPAVAMYGEQLLDWLKNQIYPVEAKFTPERAQVLCPLFFRDLLANGVTTAAVYSSVRKDSTQVAFECAERIGLRVLMGKVMMDRNVPKALLERTIESIKTSEELCREWHGRDNGRLLYAFTPRFAPSCSQELMEAAATLAKQHGAYVQTHLAENLGEIAWVRKLFPHASSYTDVYEKAGLLTRKSLLAHAIHLDTAERQSLKRADAALSHCPTSNLFLKSGLMPLRELLDMGIRIGLGSDVAGGPTLSPFEVMRSAIYVHNARRFTPHFRGGEISPATVFYMATLGGAKALQLQDTIGSLDPGKDADFVVINTQSLNPASELDTEDDPARSLLSRLVFRADDRAVERTYVRGMLRYSRKDKNAKSPARAAASRSD